eukprot:gene7984-10177_t
MAFPLTILASSFAEVFDELKKKRGMRDRSRAFQRKLHASRLRMERRLAEAAGNDAPDDGAADADAGRSAEAVHRAVTTHYEQEISKLASPRHPLLGSGRLQSATSVMSPSAVSVDDAADIDARLRRVEQLAAAS